ncbi:MAG TPA: hypothetical protein VJL32_02765 [Candidatus Paceibacterota bacterium]
MKCETSGNPLMLTLRAETEEQGLLLSALNAALTPGLGQREVVSLPVGDPVTELVITYPTRR